jgi:hypothetical protein
MAFGTIGDPSATSNAGPRHRRGPRPCDASDGDRLRHGERDPLRERLVDRDVSPDANTGTSVNPFSWPGGAPPPGWPEDTTEYGPGEGPRWEEDFYLHVAEFPISDEVHLSA